MLHDKITFLESFALLMYDSDLHLFVLYVALFVRAHLF